MKCSKLGVLIRVTGGIGERISKGAVGFIACVININILILCIKNNPVDFDRVILQWKLVKIFT